MATKVYLKFDNLAELYLRKEFNCKSGHIVLTRSHPVGRFISSLVKWTKDKPTYTEAESLALLIPDSPYMHQEFYWPYFNKEDQRAIADFVQAKLDLVIETFFVKGYRYNFTQKDIILALISHYNFPSTLATFEMLKKRDFRKRQNITKIIASLITT